MGAVLSFAISPPSSAPSSTPIDSMSLSRFDFPCEFIIEPDGESCAKQPTSDDAAAVAMDVISSNVPPPNPSFVVDLCDHTLGQTFSRLKYADLSSESAIIITSSQIPSDRSGPKSAITTDALGDCLAKRVFSTSFPVGADTLPKGHARRLSSSSPAGAYPSTPTTPVSAPSSPLTIDMASLSNLTLHSPSAQIIGTPFATSSIPFEYPFPPTNDSSTTLSSLSTRPPSPPSSPYPVFAASSSLLSDPANTLALSLSMALPSEILPAPPQMHHKMRMTPPPMPPGLMKRRKDKLAERHGSVDFVRQANHPHDILHHSFSDTDLKGRLQPFYSSNGVKVPS